MNDTVIAAPLPLPIKKKIHPVYSVFILLAGVVLPVVSITIEVMSHWCAEVFFDPIPTWGHIALVSFVPLANLLVWLALQKPTLSRPQLVGYVNALSIAISACYTVVFLSLTPLAIPMVLMFGMGLLALTPHLSLIAASLLRWEFGKAHSQSKPAAFGTRALVIAFAATLGFFAVMEIPRTVTRVGLKMAVSDSPETQAKGIRLLRSWGDRETLLRFCYVRSFAMETDIVGRLWTQGESFDPAQVRQIYYRVTGHVFSAAPRPREMNRFFDDFGGEGVTDDEVDVASFGREPGLTLADSKMDGSIDADAALAYLEWTLVFRNEHGWQQEAQASIQLPADAVVSRLTLWIDGQEREAAFAAKGRVTAAYERVVSKRRDPVLVVTDGHDKIRVRCFPVPPKGGEMKIRVGMTVPLMLEDTHRGVLRLPYFQQRNFAVARDFAHAVWIESKQPLESVKKNLQLDNPQPNLFAARGALKDSELSQVNAPVRTARLSESSVVWAKDTVEESEHFVLQKIEMRPRPAHAQLVFVVDTSLAMKALLNQVTSAIADAPAHLKLSLVLAGGNGLNENSTAPRVFNGDAKHIIATLNEAQFDGGADNVPALLTAWDAASQAADSAIVWIHGPQPIRLTSIEALTQRWMRRPGSVPLYMVQVSNGVNMIAAALDDIDDIRPVLRAGDAGESLQRFLLSLGQSQPWRVLDRVLAIELAASSSAADQAKETSAHLVRLWARDEVRRLMRAHKPEQDALAQQIAARYQLVTPISGAVVLESNEQYQEAGLTPVEPGTVPTIPEPELVALIAVGTTVVFVLIYRRRRAARWV